MRRLIFVALLAILLPHPAQSQQDRIDTLLAEMTLAEKVGQMFMVNQYGTALTVSGESFIAEMHPGAVALFGRNLDDEPLSQVASFINEMQTVATENGAGVPLFVAIDQEGGRVQRLVNDVTYLPDPLALGAATEAASIQRVGAAIGAELNGVGFNMNLAPVADLQTRDDMLNPYRVMHRRTFGDDAERVGWQVAAFTDGLAESNVVGVLKHYPGHGGAADSHAGLPLIDVDAETARATALRAFEVAVQEGVPSIMVGHLYYSQLEPEDNLPATLSPTLLGILRNDFGFAGVIMTDAMDMGALADNFYVPDAALRFVQAGGDMIVAGPYLTPTQQIESMQRIVQAVENGEITEARIDESVRRILQLKMGYGLLDWEPVDTEDVAVDLEQTRAALIETYMDAATVLRDASNLLPLQSNDSVAIVFPGIYPSIQLTCEDFAPDATYHGYIFHPADWEFGTVARFGREHDKIVIFVEDALLNPRQIDLIQAAPPEKTIVVAMSLPYDLEAVPEISTPMAIYNSLTVSHIAACRVLFGDHPIQGRLPVAVGDYPTGSGIDIE